MLALPPGAALAHSPMQTGNCTTANPSDDPAVGPTPTVCLSVLADLQSTTEAFAVSWNSALSEAGSVQLLGDSSIPDVRDPAFTGTTHYVKLDILQPSASYRFDILSGQKTYTNNRAHWSLAGPKLPAPGRDPIQGRIKNPDGGNAGEAIVYVTIVHADDNDKSALLSQVVTDEDAGYITINLAYARTPDFSARFAYNKNTDKVLVMAVGAAGLASAPLTKISDLRPGKPGLTLTLGTGAGTAATATPSPIPATSTPTPSATPTLPPETGTAIAATETAAVFTETATATHVPATATRVPPTETPELDLMPTAAPPPSETAERPTIASAEPTAIAAAGEASPLAPSPRTTRLAPRVTPASAANSTVGGLALDNSSLGLLAVAAFIGAMILGGTAFFLWKR